MIRQIAFRIYVRFPETRFGVWCLRLSLRPSREAWR